MDRAGVWTAASGAARLLIRHGYDYVAVVRWYQPNDRRLRPFPEGLAAAARLICEAQAAGVGPQFMYFSNMFEGSASLSIAALAELLETEEIPAPSL